MPIQLQVVFHSTCKPDNNHTVSAFWWPNHRYFLHQSCPFQIKHHVNHDSFVWGERASLVAMHAWTLSSQQLALFFCVYLFMTCLDSRALIDVATWGMWLWGENRDVELSLELDWTRGSGIESSRNSSVPLFTRKARLSMNSPLRAALDALLARVSRWMFPCVGFCWRERSGKFYDSSSLKFSHSNLLLFVQKEIMRKLWWLHPSANICVLMNSAESIT